MVGSFDSQIRNRDFDSQLFDFWL